MKKIIKQFIQFSFIAVCSSLCIVVTGCSNSSGKKLQVEYVDAPAEEEVQLHPMFNDGPNVITPISKYSGVVDTIGSDLVLDLDGDGILNENEGLSNAWVADYPSLETYIAPPVTMKIEILYSGESTTTTLTSEISANDVSSVMDNSSDTAHREEVNLRTVQFQDSYNEATSSDYNNEKSSNRSTGISGFVSALGTGAGKKGDGGSSGGSPSAEFYGGSLGYNYGRQSSSMVANSYKNAYGETTTKWTTIPFKNNLNRRSSNLKRDAASRNALKLRQQMNTSTQQTERIEPNAGYVRAALYICNDSVNMPVRLSNILCSFMLEAPDGQLIPVQSFRLRNDDYSLLEIELYGGSTFGPYVIELCNLNTYEIKDAIANGYNPKLFIVNYTMTHVDDSNYKELLEKNPGIKDNFVGSNLKIIEENAKGRTAGVKIVGPNIRKFFRVAAFNTDGVETRTGVSVRSGDTNGQVDVMPGVHLEKALDRIAYSGLNIEYGFYLLDFTGIEPEMNRKRFVVRAIKSINGVKTKIPCLSDTPVDGKLTGIDFDGNDDDLDIQVHIMKPITDWADDDYKNFKVWTVFADGKYFMYSADLVQTKPDGDLEQRKFNMTGDVSGLYTDIDVVEGIQSMIWPGDHYDIVYLDLAEYLNLIDEFGNNPIEKVTSLKLNTRWSLADYGSNPDHYFYPDTNSYFLGSAGLGDAIQFTVKLDRTGYLDPSFGAAVDDEISSYNYSDYSYRIDESLYHLSDSVNKYTLEEALDLQISFSLDGKMGDWINIVPGKNLGNDSGDLIDYIENVSAGYIGKPVIIDRSWDFMNQEYSFTIQLPYDMAGVGEDQLVSIYMRTAPHNVYREVMWPVAQGSVKKFRGRLAATVYATNLVIIDNCIGTPEIGDTINICTREESVNYTITQVTPDDGDYILTLDSNVTEHVAGERVYVNYSTTPAFSSSISMDYNFIEEWNNNCPVFTLATYLDVEDNRVPLVTADTLNNPYLAYCDDIGLGYVETNWAGGQNYNNPGWNSWNDASLFDSIVFPDLTSYTLLENRDAEEVVTSTMKINFSNISGTGEIPQLFFKAPLLERDYTVEARFVDFRGDFSEEGE